MTHPSLRKIIGREFNIELLKACGWKPVTHFKRNRKCVVVNWIDPEDGQELETEKALDVLIERITE